MHMAAPIKRLKDWDDAPAPILVVEVLSGSKRRRDNSQKREFYLDAGVAEYWIVDPDRESLRVIRPGTEDVVATADVTWQPTGADASLTVRVPFLFGHD